MKATTHHVVIVGGGFGGLSAAKALGSVPRVRITLIDKRNYHLFTPLLYQVATAGLSPADIAVPLRGILRRHRNVRTLQSEVLEIDPIQRAVIVRDGVIPYDTLILAAGTQPSYFGHEQWRAAAPSLGGIGDALEIRQRVLLAFEAAERETDPARRQALLTFVIVGAGPTGVELAGALAELAHATLRDDFREIDPREARIILVERGERILPTFHPSLARVAERHFKGEVTIRTATEITDVRPGTVVVRQGGDDEEISAYTVMWAAGIQGGPLASELARKTGAVVDRAGRVHVEPDLSIRNHPDIFVVGDLAHFAHTEDGQPLLGVAQVGMQQGAYVGKLVKARLRGQTIGPFRYRDLGRMAVIGRNAAIFERGRLRFGGFLAWLLWVGLHIYQLVGFSNRLLVMLQWAFYYFTFKQRARLITMERVPLLT